MEKVIKFVKNLKGTKEEKLAQIKAAGNRDELEVWEMFEAFKLIELNY